MLLTIFIVLALLTLISGVGIVGWQMIRLRRGEVVVSALTAVSLGDLLQRKIDQWYYGFDLFLKQLVHFSYFYSLITLRRAIIIARFLLVRIERRFSRLIDSIRGKGVIHKKGAVSVFLTQIGEPKA